MKRLDLVGKTFGKLFVTGFAGVGKGTMFACKCKCGMEKIVRGSYLINGQTRSCGCLKKINAQKMGKATKKHGMCGTKVYKTWRAMMQRCYDANCLSYKDYGSRGIKVCQRWHRFENFYEDMKAPKVGMQLERTDNDKGYSPKNCKWATRKQQMRNRRNTLFVQHKGETKSLKELCETYEVNYQTAYSRLKNGELLDVVLSKTHREFFRENNPNFRFVTFQGETKKTKDWAQQYGIPASTFLYRINNGWTIEEALLTPVSKFNKIKTIRTSK